MRFEIEMTPEQYSVVLQTLTRAVSDNLVKGRDSSIHERFILCDRNDKILAFCWTLHAVTRPSRAQGKF